MASLPLSRRRRTSLICCTLPPVELGTVVASQAFAVIHQGLKITLEVNPHAGAPSTPQEAQTALISIMRQSNVTISRQKRQKPQQSTASASVTTSLATPSPSLNPKLNLGGLDEEVKLMRELVFLPLMRPDLFEQHSESSVHYTGRETPS